MVLLTALRPIHMAKPNNQTKAVAVHTQYPSEQYSKAPVVPLPPLRTNMMIRTAHINIMYPMVQYGVEDSIATHSSAVGIWAKRERLVSEDLYLSISTIDASLTPDSVQGKTRSCEDVSWHLRS